MRFLHFLFFFSLAVNCVSANVLNDSLFRQLDITLANRLRFMAVKEARIKQLQQQLSRAGGLTSRFELYKALFSEYKSFRYDSAYRYSKALEAVAVLLHDPVKLAIAKTDVSFTLLSSGMFKETIETLNQVDTRLLDNTNRMEYYFLKGRCYYDWYDYNHNADYNKVYYPKAVACMDSALAISPKTSYYYWAIQGLNNMRMENYNGSAKAYLTLLKLPHLSVHDFAITASSLSYVYSRQGRKDQAIELLIRAAIADISTATEETVAIYNLASLLYKGGNQDAAFNYINEAMDEAVFYGARQRQVAISGVLPVIEAQRIKSIEEQRRSLMIYSSVITFLVLFLIAFALIIRRQLKKLRAADDIIKAANLSLQQGNTALEEVNRNLSTANKIKNEYISYYFNINSVYIEKLEDFQKSMERKLKSQRYEDAMHSLKNLNLENERHELFNTFDKVLTGLFPDFLLRFNALFKEGETVCVPAGQLLSTEHRIFALIRMGIHDNERIAKLLGYSVNTIYAYKNRIKTKSLVPNDEFERYIMAIEAV